MSHDDNFYSYVQQLLQQFYSSADPNSVPVINESLREKKGGRIVVMRPEYPSESCFTVSMRVFFQIMKSLKPDKVFLELENIADVKSTLSKLPSTSLFTCGALNVHAADLSFLSLFMPHVTPGCELGFYNSDPFLFEDSVLDSVVFDLEVMKAAPYLDSAAVCEINDEQFIHLSASWLYLRAPRILEKSINKLILQWIEGRRKITRIYIAKTKTFDYDMIFKDVNKIEIHSGCELLQIPFLTKYVEEQAPHIRLALIQNGFGGRLLVNLGFSYCELVDPHSEYMSRTYRQ